AGPAEPEDHGRISEGPVQQSRKPLDVRAEVRNRLRRRILPVLRIQKPDAGDADGNDVRHRVPALCRRVRKAGGCGLRESRGGTSQGLAKAFSSEVDTGSREENASKRRI